MKIYEVLEHRGKPIDLLSNPEHYYDKLFYELVSTWDTYFNSSVITSHQAEMIIAFDREMSDALSWYKVHNTMDNSSALKISSIIVRVKPFNKVLYRGTVSDGYDDNHSLPFQSWSANIETARTFAETTGIMWETVGLFKGIEMGNIFYFHDQLYGGEYGYMGDDQAEWLVLSPKKKRIDNENL